jgi:carboxyl-terminal processing protease
MRGAVGTTVQLTIRRGGQLEPIELRVTRAVVVIPSVEGRLLDGDIAYVRLKSFQEGCYQELLDVLANLGKSTKLRGMLFDLRGNPGGLVSEAVAIADELLDRGTIYSARHRGKVVEIVSSSEGDLLEKLPVLVLVNAGTASSAEIVAGALQDRGRAKVVGEPSFGKGSVQNIIELSGGAGLLLTTLRYFTPSGRAIQARGLVPDVLVKAETDLPRVREADIAGHLQTEGAEPNAPRATAQPNAIASAPFAAGTAGEQRAANAETPDGASASAKRPPPPERSPIQAIPSNPTRGTDPVLAKGFEMLSAQLPH